MKIELDVTFGKPYVGTTDILINGHPSRWKIKRAYYGGSTYNVVFRSLTLGQACCLSDAKQLAIKLIQEQ